MSTVRWLVCCLWTAEDTPPPPATLIRISSSLSSCIYLALRPPFHLSVSSHINLFIFSPLHRFVYFLPTYLFMSSSLFIYVHFHVVTYLFISLHFSVPSFTYLFIFSSLQNSTKSYTVKHNACKDCLFTHQKLFNIIIQVSK